MIEEAGGAHMLFGYAEARPNRVKNS